MNVHLLYSDTEANDAEKFTLSRARLSYVADGNRLLSEKLSENSRGDIMVVSAEKATENISDPILRECRKRGYSAVFLDADEKKISDDTRDIFSHIAISLSHRSLKVFCPFGMCNGSTPAIPVISACVSGGDISDFLRASITGNQNIALYIPRIMQIYTMPASDAFGKEIKKNALSVMLADNEITPFYSPQMMINYFLSVSTGGEVRYTLFDDARSISEKIRLAKKLGIADIFLTYREVSDILHDIIG